MHYLENLEYFLHQNIQILFLVLYNKEGKIIAQ